MRHLLLGLTLIFISNKQPSSKNDVRYKLDKNIPSEVLWQKKYGGLLRDEPQSVITTPDGGFLIGSTSWSPLSGDKTEDKKGLSDYWVVKLDSLGNKQWDRTLGGIKVEGDLNLGGSPDEMLSCLIATQDGGYLVGGTSRSDISGDKTSPGNGYTDIWMVKLDSSGKILWDRTYGGIGSDNLHAITATPDGNFLLVGSTSSPKMSDKSQSAIKPETENGWLIKINSIGLILWEKTYGRTAGGDGFLCILQAPNGGYYLGGYTRSITASRKSRSYDADFWLVKVDVEGNQEWEKTYGGIDHETLNCMAFSKNKKSILLGGSTKSPKSRGKSTDLLGLYDIWLVNVSLKGKLIWDRSFGGEDMEEIATIYSSPSSGWIFAGHSRSNPGKTKTLPPEGGTFMDYWMAGIDRKGNHLWDKQWGTDVTELMAASVSPKPGSYLLVGSRRFSPNASLDLWLLRVSTKSK